MKFNSGDILSEIDLHYSFRLHRTGWFFCLRRTKYITVKNSKYGDQHFIIQLYLPPNYCPNSLSSSTLKRIMHPEMP